MLRFQAFENGRRAETFPLRNCYLIGSDGNAIRSDIRFENAEIICEKRDQGTAALALQHPMGDLGELTVQTCLLPERDDPYNLSIELARHRLMVLYTKLEEWGMFDLDDDHPVSMRAERARRRFIDALCSQGNPAEAAKHAEACLTLAMDGSEELALTHSELLLRRRRSTGSVPRAAVGCGVDLNTTDPRLRQTLTSGFDFLQLPTPWKQLAPEEGDYRWGKLDEWCRWAAHNKMAVIGGPVISFDPLSVPDWLYIWEHDYDTVRDLIYEHVERLIERYKGAVRVWNVVSGLHVNSHFTFNFDQLMDLTRMSTMLIKKLAPSSRVLLEVRQPFGEYYGANQRSIPPLMYGDLIMQSAIQFDMFGVRLLMGAEPAGAARAGPDADQLAAGHVRGVRQAGVSDVCRAECPDHADDDRGC